MNLRRIVDKLSNLSNPGIIMSLLEFSNNVPNVTKAKTLSHTPIPDQLASILNLHYRLYTHSGWLQAWGYPALKEGAIWCSILSQVLSSRHFKLALYTASPWTRGICKVNFEEPRVTIVPTHYSSLAFNNIQAKSMKGLTTLIFVIDLVKRKRSAVRIQGLNLLLVAQVFSTPLFLSQYLMTHQILPSNQHALSEIAILLVWTYPLFYCNSWPLCSWRISSTETTIGTQESQHFSMH